MRGNCLSGDFHFLWLGSLHSPANLLQEGVLNINPPIEPPPDGMNADDLATTLLYHMQVGRNQANMLAAAEALRIKSSHKGWTVSKAYIHIVQRWTEYKQSEHYRSKFRRGAAGFLNEGDYDNPALWGGTKAQPEVSTDIDPIVKEMRELRRDRAMNPDKYVSQSEIAELFRSVSALQTKKRMPSRRADIRPMTIDPERNRQKLESQAQKLLENPGE